MSEIAPEQAELVAFLASPEAHGGERPERIDTHLSHVFLTEDTVLKLKRAIRLDFVDYSTPEQRRRYCEREVAANAAWARSLYCGVEPVRKTPDGFLVGGADADGEPVDWLVRMHRFADGDRLDKRLAAGTVALSDIEGFADALAGQHDAAAPDTGAGGSDAFAQLIDQVGGDLCEAGRSAVWQEQAGQWHDRAMAALKDVRGLIDRRVKAGRVRLCHGDLHLKNICYWQGALIGYDALEFDPALSMIDVLYDMAFPVMDCLHFRAGWAANALMNRYLARTGDYDGLALLPLYLSQRAAIRAMATGMAGKTGDARAYLALARDLLAVRPQPVLIALGGRSGSGKSTLARAIAPGAGMAPGAVVLRSDVIRKVLAGEAPEAPLPASAYGAGMTDRVYETMGATARTCLAAGMSCIMDATFLSRPAEAALEAAREGFEGRVFPIWLEAPADVLRDRIAARGADASDADLAVLEGQLSRPEPAGWTPVDVAGSPEAAIAHIRKALAA
ncbi:MAG: AAA family ATPase [Pseudomonadota bacterium]|nr:AAA family ATPase [Pseudomonadota bacterium]